MTIFQLKQQLIEQNQKLLEQSQNQYSIKIQK